MKIAERKQKEAQGKLDKLDKLLNDRVVELFKKPEAIKARHNFIFYRELVRDIKKLI